MTHFLGLDSSEWFAVAGQVAWQSTAVLALGLIASKIRPIRPSRGHQILLASTLGCLVISPAWLVARRLDCGLFSARAESKPERSAPVLVRFAANPTPRPIPSETPRTVDAKLPRMVPAASQVGSTPPTIPAIEPISPGFDTSSARLTALIAWALLSVIGFSRLVGSFLLGFHLKSRASILRQPELIKAAEVASMSLGLARTPEVRTSSHVRCPVVWCWGSRPVLILPDSATDLDHGSAVLCHELAHWKRADHLSSLAAEVLTCLIPWQPLAWLCRGRMADLSELACDDWALAHARGVSPPDYAETLLNLAAERRRPLVLAAVSRRSGLGVRVRHILKDTEPMPRTGRFWNLSIAALSLGLVALLALAQTRQARAIVAEQPAPRKEEKMAEPPKPIAIEGTVRGPKGEGLPGVEVFWVGAFERDLSYSATPHDDRGYGKQRDKVLARGTTDGQGHFSLQGAFERPKPNRASLRIVAYKGNLAPGSRPVPLDGKPVDLILEPPARIVGRFLTPGGDPASGVKVRLTDYSNGQWNDPRMLRHMDFGDESAWDPRPAFLPDEFITDDSGRFVIEGYVPVGMFANIDIKHPDYAVENLTISTRPNTEPTTELAAFNIQPLPKEFTHTLIPARPVVGQITDSETKKPLVGVTVEVTPMREDGGMPIRTKTDAEGRYRVSDKEGQMYWVAAFPATGSGYLPVTQNIDKWPEGQTELRVDMALRRGQVLRGRVIDEASGKPVPGVGVVYSPIRKNPNVRNDHDFRSPALTDAEGRFALSGVRGQGIIAAEAPSEDYIRRAVEPTNFKTQGVPYPHGATRFEVPSEGEAPEVVVKLTKGFTLEARAVRPDGSTIESVRAWCPELNARLLNNWLNAKTFADGLFRLPGAEPGRTYRVFFLDQDQQFGAVVELKADPSRTVPFEVKLEPTASYRGRVLDFDGTPLQRSQILSNIQLIDKGDQLAQGDRHGDKFVVELYVNFTGESLKPSYPAEFEHKGLIPGVRYFVTWFTGNGGANDDHWRAVEPLKPGEARNLGDLRSEKKGGKDAN